MFSGLAGPDQPPPGALGVALVVLTGVAGVVGTALWWRQADHDR
ncbi:hypothetical protein [Lentzea flava]|nr:hypothetical protein [Lentzea flava]